MIMFSLSVVSIQRCPTILQQATNTATWGQRTAQATEFGWVRVAASFFPRLTEKMPLVWWRVDQNVNVLRKTQISFTITHSNKT
jgi:hypothetical protein